MADSTALIIVILPPNESNFSFQPASLLRILSMIWFQRDFFSLPTDSGKPK